jgi:hypothetical protein
MKYAFLGDIHLGVRHGNAVYHNYISHSITQMIKEMHKCGITDIFQMGDFFDNRRQLPVNIIPFIIHELPTLLDECDITLHIIAGNHDIFNLHDLFISSLDVLQHKRYKVYKKPSIVDNFVLIPWVTKSNYDDTMAILNTADKQSTVIGHFELNGFKMQANGGEFEHEHFDMSILKKFQTVLTGHFHHQSKKGNIHYIGSCLALTRSDIPDIENKGWYDESLTLHKVENDLFFSTTIFTNFNENEVLKKSENKNVDIIIDKTFADESKLTSFKKKLSNIPTLSIKFIDERCITPLVKTHKINGFHQMMIQSAESLSQNSRNILIETYNDCLNEVVVDD